MERIWQCKIGGVIPDEAWEPGGEYAANDAPMRQAVEAAFLRRFGTTANFTFSGWGAELTEPERAVVEDRPPAFVMVGSYDLPVPPGSEDRLYWYRMQHNHVWYRVLACCRSCATRKLHAAVFGMKGSSNEVVRDGYEGQVGA